MTEHEWVAKICPFMGRAGGFAHEVSRRSDGTSVILSRGNGTVLETEFEPGWTFKHHDRYAKCDEVIRRVRKKEAEYLAPRPPELLKIPTPSTKDAA